MTEAEVQEVIDQAMAAYDRARTPTPPLPPPPPADDGSADTAIRTESALLSLAASQNPAMSALLRGSSLEDAAAGKAGRFSQVVQGRVFDAVLPLERPIGSLKEASAVIEAVVSNTEAWLREAGVTATELHEPERIAAARAQDAMLGRDKSHLLSSERAEEAGELMRRVYAEETGESVADQEREMEEREASRSVTVNPWDSTLEEAAKDAPKADSGPRWVPAEARYEWAGEEDAAEVMEAHFDALMDAVAPAVGSATQDPFGIEAQHAERRRLGELAELDRWKAGGSEYPESMQQSREAETARMRELEAKHGGSE